jgi:lysophospholipase L1-like esterase
MKILCESYGSHLTILVPPAMAEDHAEILLALGKELGIRVLVPEQPGAMPRSLFRDGFHLNPVGATIFTEKLKSLL